MEKELEIHKQTIFELIDTFDINNDKDNDKDSSDESNRN
jgi:hypothetical protein